MILRAPSKELYQKAPSNLPGVQVGGFRGLVYSTQNSMEDEEESGSGNKF